MRKSEAFLGHLIQGRRLNLPLAVAPEISVTKIVSENDNKVRFGSLGGKWRLSHRQDNSDEQ
jgi:hypothetical protein